MNHLKNPSLTILISVALLSIGTVTKIYLGASSELKTAEAFFSQKKLSLAATHYERSIQWYIPGLDLQNRAAQGLWDVGRQYESQNDIENALTTYRLLRGAFYSVRSFYTPGRKWIDRCNEKIAVLMAAKPAPSDADKNKSTEQRQTEILALLTAEKAPNNLWAITGVFGFFGWVTCSIFLIAQGLTKSGEIKARPAILWGIGFIVFYGLWVLGMYST